MPSCRMCASPELAHAGSVGGYGFVECGGCGLVFAPALTRARMDSLYRSGHGLRDGAPAEGWANSLEFLAPALARLDGRLEILDFGCGTSFLPDQLRGLGHRVVAVDLAPPMAPEPDRLTGELDALGLPTGRFDLAYAFQVFEHLPEPDPILSELLRVVRPGGLLVVHTDMEAPARVEPLSAWSYVAPPDHCTFFRHRTFEVALAGGPHAIVHRDPKCVTVEIGADTNRT